MTREEARIKLIEIRAQLEVILSMYGLEISDVFDIAIEALEQEPKRISVSERLPEEKQSVLVWCPLYKNIYCAYLEKGQWWIFGAFAQIVPNEVVAWMPLPKSYKAESEEKE